MRAALRATLPGLVCCACTYLHAQPSESSGTSPALTPALTYDGTIFSNLKGGAQRGSAYVGNLQVKLTVRGDPLGLPGTSAFIDVLDIHGGHPSRLAGDVQGTSNIEGPGGTQIEEFWIQHNFEGNHLSVLGGIYDVNSEFYRLQSAGLFVNSAFGIGPEFAQSGAQGPSIFPRTSLGLRVAVKPDPNIVIRGAVLNGMPVARPDGSHALFRSGDGLLSLVEIALLSRPHDAQNLSARSRDRLGRFSSLSPYDDKVAIGTWRYTGSYPDLSEVDSTGTPVQRGGSSGAYLVLERLLLDGAGPSKHRLAAFAQAGIADARTNRFGSHFGAGVVGSGWSLLKETDQFGIALTNVRNGSHYARAGATNPGPKRSETTLEASYLTQICKSLTVQPDLQFVAHPDTDPTRANAWVAQLRFELSY